MAPSSKDFRPGKDMLTGCLLLMIGATGASGAEPESLTSLKAYQLARAGKILILDVRPRADWERGVPVGAVVVDKDQPLDAFISTIDRLALRNKGRRLAVICAAGIRSAEVQTILDTAGHRRVLSVSDGVEGNTTGPGWIKRGLPMKRPSPRSIGAGQN